MGAARPLPLRYSATGPGSMLRAKPRPRRKLRRVLSHAGNDPSREFGCKRFDDEGYAMEELVAELGAAFLSADLGLTPEARADHASYIASWLKVLKDDRRAIFTAASHVQRAADYLGASARAKRPQSRRSPRPAYTPVRKLDHFSIVM